MRLDDEVCTNTFHLPFHNSEPLAGITYGIWRKAHIGACFEAPFSLERGGLLEDQVK